MAHILKNKQKNSCLYSWDYTINYNETEDGNEKRSHTYNINRTTIMFITLWDFFMGEQIFHWSLWNIRKSKNCIELLPSDQSSPQNEIVPVLVKIS